MIRPDLATVAVLACCPFLGAGAVLVLDPAASTPPAITAQAPAAPTDAPVPPLLVQEPTVETTTSPSPERPTSATVRTTVPAAPPRPVESAPEAAPTPAPQPTATPIPDPKPEPGPEPPIWTQADQDAADARCEASRPGSRAENTPNIGDTYDPDLHYPCAGEPRRNSSRPHP